MDPIKLGLVGYGMRGKDSRGTNFNRNQFGHGHGHEHGHGHKGNISGRQECLCYI